MEASRLCFGGTMFDFDSLDEAEYRSQAPVRAEAAAKPAPVRACHLQGGVAVSIFQEGDTHRLPTKFLEIDYVGRLPNGCVFDCSAGKGQPPMRVELGTGGVIPGMELGLRALSLGAVAEIRIPGELGYGEIGIPKMIPPNSELLFEVHVLAVDGQVGPQRRCELPRGAREHQAAGTAESLLADGVLVHPWWLQRVERPLPTSYYLNFCKHMARALPPEMLERARAIPRRTRAEAAGWDLTGGAAIVAGVQDSWRARDEWDLEWFDRHLGSTRQLVKWQGPVYTTQESQWDCPTWETSLSEYIAYVKAVDAADPDGKECNAEQCPRLYLNGWPAFSRLPWLREYVVNPTFMDDVSGQLIADNEELREAFISGVTKGYSQPPEEYRRKVINDEYWELTKLFISPKGALTRLHFDNGGAHVWLSQVRGRKLFVCFPPSDGPYLHAFDGDEGVPNGSWIDPLDEDVLSKWPDYEHATPYVAVVEEGETLFAPQGWWHYTVGLDTSITIMRNFYSTPNKAEHVRRKDEALASAVGTHILKRQAKLRDQPEKVLQGIARQTVSKLREQLEARGGIGSKGRVPCAGGPEAT